MEEVGQEEKRGLQRGYSEAGNRMASLGMAVAPLRACLRCRGRCLQAPRLFTLCTPVALIRLPHV